MGLLDGVLGGVVGGEMATVVNSLIEKHGGMQGLIAQFEKQGLGSTVKSWVGNGANLPITPDQVHQVLGSQTVQAMAARFGINPQEMAQRIAQALPKAIDHLTPTGAVNPGGQTT